MAGAAGASAPAAPSSASGLMPMINRSEWWLNVEQARATGVIIPDWMLGDAANTGGVVLVRQLCDAVVELQDVSCENVDNATAFLLASAKVPVSGHRRYSASIQAHGALIHFLARRLAQDPQRVSAITATYSKLLSALATQQQAQQQPQQQSQQQLQQQPQQPYLLPTIPAADLTAAEAAAQVRQHFDSGALFLVLDHGSRDVSSFIAALDAARLPALEFQRVGWGNAEGMSGTKPPAADIKYGSMARLAASCDAALLVLARQVQWGERPAPTTSRQHWCAFASALLCHLPDVHPDQYQAGAELEGGSEVAEEGQQQQEEGSEGPPSKRAKVSNGSSKGRRQKKAAPLQEQEQQGQAPRQEQERQQAQAQAQQQEQQQDALNNEAKPTQQEQQHQEEQQQHGEQQGQQDPQQQQQQGQQEQHKSAQDAVREAQLQVLQAQAEEMAQYRALHPKELWAKGDRVWEGKQARGGASYPPPLGFLGISRTKRVAFLRTAYGHDTHIARNPGVVTGLSQVLQHLGLYVPNGEGSKDGKYTWLVPPGHGRQGQAAAEGLQCFDATQVKGSDGKIELVTELQLPRAGSLLQRAQEQRWPCDSTLLLLSDDATGAAVRANCGGDAAAAAAGHAAGTAAPQATATEPVAEGTAGTSSAAAAAVVTTAPAPAADPAAVGATTTAAAPPTAPPAGVWPHATLQVFSTLSELCQIYSYAFTTTSLHTEDLALGAMNTLVAGAPKMWLVAPTRQVAEAFYARVGAARRPAFFSKLLHLRTPGLGVDDLLDLGMVPLVQQPGMTVVSATSMDAIHVTVSSGFSLAQSANCHYSGRASLGQHVEEVVARGEPPANKAVLAHYRAVAAAGGSYSVEAVLRRPGKK